MRNITTLTSLIFICKAGGYMSLSKLSKGRLCAYYNLPLFSNFCEFSPFRLDTIAVYSINEGILQDDKIIYSTATFSERHNYQQQLCREIIEFLLYPKPIWPETSVARDVLQAKLVKGTTGVK